MALATDTGRAEVMLGRGSFVESFPLFGLDLADYELLFEEKLDLFAAIPHGTGQTYLREVLLVADHNAYHVGQIVAVRKLLGFWK